MYYTEAKKVTLVLLHLLVELPMQRKSFCGIIRGISERYCYVNIEPREIC